MKSQEELDHYEVLEVPRQARTEEIERAYMLVRSAYESDSLAAYSLLAPDEAKVWCERIDEAWRVLADPGLRGAYDATLALAAESGSAVEPPADDEGEAAGAGPAALRFEDPEPPPSRGMPGDLAAFEEEHDEGAPWDGPRLRRARLLRGIEIEQLAASTKINPTYLRFLEDERFDDLPALVYVRGFVASYARQLGLDPELVARGYTARCEESRSKRPRGRMRRR
jgi:flagellar biosynthesis protein FlhG